MPSTLKIDNFDDDDGGISSGLDHQSARNNKSSANSSSAGKNNIMPSSTLKLQGDPLQSVVPFDENNIDSRGSSLDKSSESSAGSSSSTSSAGSSAKSSVGNNNINMKISDKVEEELSQLWDSGQEWILIFDNLLKHPGGKVGKGCKCDMCEMQKGPNNGHHGCYNNDSAFESLENSSGKYFFSPNSMEK